MSLSRVSRYTAFMARLPHDGDLLERTHDEQTGFGPWKETT